MAKKKFNFTVYVENWGSAETYFNVLADTPQEAKAKAKKLFMKDYWKPSMLKASVETKELNI